MKSIKYTMMTEINHGTEEEPDIKQIFNNFEIQCAYDVFEENLAIAQREAYNGEYTIFDDGFPAFAPTEQEQLRADVDFLLMLAEEG